MKRLILIIFLCAFYSLASAQNNEPGVSFGFKAGVSISNMNFNKGYPKPAEHLESSWKTGFVLGFIMQVPVYRKLSIQPEYLYLQTAGENKSINATYDFSYISLPVLFKYPITNRLSLMAGPQFDLLINASQTQDNMKTKITHDTEERSIFGVAALEFNISGSLSINGRYLHGINHIGIGQRSDVTEFKYEAAQLSAAIKF